ncbi:hypothetical protein IWY39_002600 [Sphingobium sp. JAI105]|uniref:hypothetical protein n=1 Tax=Sphingobium sp. JAI105 TaxID=2787715 RepID=UPI0018CAF97D|nr:hypothetical protein [Sphingobium sp. JAI105]MBG6116236.1 hypothetical protein [Sphingobium sp. JAI105]MBG6118796.1 hypothetical protein [Sphingobium sp. JAI105]
MKDHPRTRTGFDADDLPAPNCWRTTELAILDREYPTGGSATVHRLLPHRTRRTIQQVAWTRGIRKQRRQAQGEARA